MVNLGDRLRYIRKQKGLLQKHMAEYFGIRKVQYLRVEEYDRVRVEALLRILEMLELDLKITPLEMISDKEEWEQVILEKISGKSRLTSFMD